MLIYQSAYLGSDPAIRLKFYGNVIYVNSARTSCTLCVEVVGEYSSASSWLGTHNNLTASVRVAGQGWKNITMSVTWSGNAANRSGYDLIGSNNFTIPINPATQYITITDVRSTSTNMSTSGILSTTAINVKIPVPIRSRYEEYTTPLLGSGPSIKHSWHSTCVRRTSNQAVMSFDVDSYYGNNGSFLAKFNTLTCYATVEGSTVTVPMAVWTQGAQDDGSYVTSEIALHGMSFNTMTFSAPATDTSLSFTRTRSTSYNMQTSGVQNSWTTVSGVTVSIPRFTYMSFSGTTLGSTMTITINSINNNTFHTHTITFNGSTDSTSATKSRTRTLTASTFGPKFSSTSKTLSLPVTVTSYDYLGSLGSYTQNVTVTMPASIGQPTVYVSATYSTSQVMHFDVEVETKYGATVSSISFSTTNFTDIRSTNLGNTKWSIDVYVPETNETITEDTFVVKVTDSRGFTVTQTLPAVVPTAILNIYRGTQKVIKVYNGTEEVPVVYSGDTVVYKKIGTRIQ